MDNNSKPADIFTHDGIARRDFLRVAGFGAGALLLGNACDREPERSVLGITPPGKSWGGSGAGHVVVVGAGAWGGWTALNLRRRGARVTLVDAYGAGNSRASSGDETRGIRSSYGDRTVGETWTQWAREAILRWREFDDQYAKEFGTKFFHHTGDVILRAEPEPFTTRTAELWTKFGVPFETLQVDEVRKRWPVINSDDSTVVLYEPDAGVVRARYATQAVATIAEREGVERMYSRVRPGPVTNGKMDGVILDDGTIVHADAYVFACGPWLPKVFPELFGNRMRIPLGVVCYYGVPAGDNRFTFPNLPSWNFPGVTGWPTLPVDNRGFRSRGSLSNRPAGNSNTSRAGAQNNASANQQPRAPQPPPDPAQNDPDTSVRWAAADRLEGSRRFIERRFPLLANAPLIETRSCHFDSSINRDFIVDLIPDATNAWVAGAGQAEGFKFGPVIGEYIAQRVLGDSGDSQLAQEFRMPTDEYEQA